MDWVTSIHRAIQYIENNLRKELSIRDIAQHAALSPFYFQKAFPCYVASFPCYVASVRNEYRRLYKRKRLVARLVTMRDGAYNGN